MKRPGYSANSLENSKTNEQRLKSFSEFNGLKNIGNFGDCEPVGHRISELRIHYAKGYRAYLKEHNGTIFPLLLNGETKSSQ